MTLYPRSLASVVPIFSILAVSVLTLVPSVASALREVPVVVENDVTNPVPVAFAAGGPAGGQSIQYVLSMDDIPGPGVGSTYPGCLEIRSLGFQVTRPPPSGGSVTPVNIGVGSSEPIMLQKFVDAASAVLWILSVNGNSNGDTEIYVLEQREGWATPLVTFEVQLERTFVQSLTIKPTTFVEELELRYIAMQITTYTRDATGTVLFQTQHCWNLVTQTRSCSF